MIKKFYIKLLISISILIILLLLLFNINYKLNSKMNSFISNKDNIDDCYAEVMSSNEDEILNQLIGIWMKVSEQLNIRWSVCAGSYIGLIRHKGRIPWDDDFDITVMKEDLPKFKNIEQILAKYNVSFKSFWGGYKIFFNDYRGVKKFQQYGWNWPFIDIFAIDQGTPVHPDHRRAKMECFFLQKEEFPLVKKKFGKQDVYVYQNPIKDRTCINKHNWRNSLLDTGYRHQTEKKIKNKCKEKPILL